MAGDLRALAADFVRLSSEIEDVRRAMLSALTSNGSDPHPPRPARSSGGRQHPNAAKAAAAESEIIALLKDRPNLRTAEVAEATRTGKPTVTQRLQRLRDKGAITGGGAEGWVAAL
jgi:hypothetical protein